MISRRHFLALTALATAHRAIAVPSYPFRYPKASLRVIVIGAGAAGLTAAYELDKLGHKVTVLEAKDYAGGRMKTLRDFDDGLYAEAGALVLGGATTAYAKELGLNLYPMTDLFKPDNRHVVYLRNKRFEVGGQDKPEFPFDLKEDEKGLDIRPLQWKYFHNHLPKDLSSMRDPSFPQEKWLYLDDISLDEFWKKNGASDEAVELMKYRYYGAYAADLKNVSVLQLVRELASFTSDFGIPSRVEGGNDRICGEMAKKLGTKVHLSAPVRSVTQSDSAVVIDYLKEKKAETIEADLCICTVPPTVVSNIDFSNSLSEKRLTMLNSISGAAVTRTFVQTSRRFWEDDKLDGSANTDLPIYTVTHNSLGIPDKTKAIIESFTHVDRAEKMAVMNYDERVKLVKENLDLVYPGLKKYAEKDASYAWGTDKYQRGGHVSFKPGQYREFGKYLATNEDRIYFAGDSYGGVPGYSFSAFESGKRVAMQVNKLAE